MLLLSYQYEDGKDTGWKFSNVALKRTNLLVGATGSGKSRFLNSLVNISTFANTNAEFRNGDWNMTFAVNERTYRWIYSGVTEGGENRIISETLSLISPDGIEVPIYVRDPQSFLFDGNKLPKLPRNSSGIFLLKDEDLVAPVHDAFGSITRRNFFGDDLTKACAIANIPHELIRQHDTRAAKALAPFFSNLPLGVRLFLLRANKKDRYLNVVDEFKNIFRSVENIDISDGSALLIGEAQGKVPVLTIKEKGVHSPISLHEMSSGMQKVLLILTDVISMEKGGIYIIDEYENSLGINAINFLPDFLANFGNDRQFIITSHHPYLINKMPVSNWHVFHRTGSNVSVTSGLELEKRYGKSRQEAFIQLINDPLYSEEA